MIEIFLLIKFSLLLTFVSSFVVRRLIRSKKMKLKELFIFWFILCQALGYKFQCKDYEKDILRRKNDKLFLMHSFSKISNHSFDQDAKTNIRLPLTYASTQLLKIIEYKNSSFYTGEIHSTMLISSFSFKAMRVDVEIKQMEYCGHKQKDSYFVLVIKRENSKMKENSIILYGCDILTSEYITVLIIESDTYSLSSKTIEMFLQFHIASKFELSNYTNEGFCMCPSSQQFVNDCIGNDEDGPTNIQYFWIILGIITILIIILFCC